MRRRILGAIMANPKVEFGGLTFTALSPGSTVSMLANGAFAPRLVLETSSDGINWSPFVVRKTTNVLENVGDKVYFRAGSGGNTRTATNIGYFNRFSMSGTIAASGNVMSLLSGDFDDATTINSPNCFVSLFNGCTSLVSAPALPATVLASDCYRNMFKNCTSLASVQCSFTTWGTWTTDWMSGVGSTGTRTFKKPAALPTGYGTSKIPVGWTVVNL